MTKTDSYLVKQIKKLEKIAEKADMDLGECAFYESPEGKAADTVDHILEIIHESLISYKEAKEKQKIESEKFVTDLIYRPIPLPPDTFQGLENHATTNIPWWKKMLNKILLRDYV